MFHHPIASKPSCRLGFTLIETLVVIGVIGLLLALILPAIQSAWGSARRASCLANLSQIGKAMHAYQSTFGCFPPNFVCAIDAPNIGKSTDYSAFAQMQSFLTGGDAGEAVDLDLDTRFLERGKYPSPAVLKCPSEFRNSRTSCSYTVSLGVHVEVYMREFPMGGAWVARAHLRPSDFADGLALTVGVAERRVSSGAGYDPRVDIYLAAPGDGPNGPGFTPPQDWVRYCSSRTAVPKFFDARHGTDWIFGSELVYNHVLPPNSPIIDCGAFATVPICGIMTARSYHPGGVNVLMMDGSARFAPDSIGIENWWALGTRNNSDAAPSEW